ncbi:hypothetical protein C8Q78DRAFT_565565 [Trametes maxima]|nr:hypothetical protein C8Q78DRAFT_565565 [Trametes maxima]
MTCHLGDLSRCLRYRLVPPHRYPHRMATIVQLPNELLVAIFLLLKTDDFVTWIRVLAVCRRWFEVASSAPALWTQLALDSRSRIDHFEVLLRRSAALRFDVSIDLVAVDQHDRVFEALQPHALRVRALTLRFSQAQTFDLQNRLSTLSQAVSMLTLHCLATEAPTFSLTPDAYPSLRLLTATQVLPRMQPPGLHGLTSLELTQVWHVADAVGDQAQYLLLEILADMPDLENLVLRDALPPCMAFGSATLTQVTFPKLRQLSLSETVEDIKFFLHYIVLPSTARVEIVARIAEAMWEPDTEGVLLAILPDNHAVALPMISLTCALRIFAGHLKEGSVSIAGSLYADAGVWDWTILLADGEEILPDAVSILLSELSQVVHPSGLISLELHIAPHILLLDVDWRAVLERLPRLRKLVVGSLWKAEGIVRELYQHHDILRELTELELCLEELASDEKSGVLLPPEEGIAARAIESLVIVQADEAPVPYMPGTAIGSMLNPAHYVFKHSRCSACHVTGRILGSQEVRISTSDVGRKSFS